jgi:hypothetical protein
VAADDYKLFVVKGPVEIADELRLEISEWFSRRTVELLEPEVVGIAFVYRVDDGFAVTGEEDWSIAQGRKRLRAGTFKFYKTGRLAGIERQQD